MTDKEMFKDFLTKLNVKYIESENTISIKDHIDDNPGRYGVDLDIVFNDDGSLKYFSPWGE